MKLNLEIYANDVKESFIRAEVDTALAYLFSKTQINVSVGWAGLESYNHVKYQITE